MAEKELAGTQEVTGDPSILRRGARVALVAMGVVAVLGVYAVISTHYRRVGVMAPDESYYTLAARNAMRGHMPYADFAYTQMPLLPYINGAVMALVGFGLPEHRLINSIWGGIGLLALMAAVRRRLGRYEPAVLVGFVIAASPRWVFLQSMGVWCGVAGMFVNLCAAAVIWPGSVKIRGGLLALFGTAAIGCRLTNAPIIAVLAAALLIEAPDFKQRAALLGAWIGTGAAALAPFVLADPKAFWFNNLGFHMESNLEHYFSLRLLQWWDVSPPAILLGAAAAFAIPRLLAKRLYTAAFVLGAGLVGVTVPMIPKSAWGVYISAGVPVLAAGAVLAYAAVDSRWSSPHRRVAWLLPLMTLCHTLPLEISEGAATEVEEVARFIREEVEPGLLLTPAGVIAVEASRDVLPGLEMGAFSAMYSWQSKRAERYHMTTLEKLERAVVAQEPAAVVRMIEPEGWRSWNFRWALPAMERQPEPQLESFARSLETCYRSAWRSSTTEVLVRKTAPEGPEESCNQTGTKEKNL